MEESYRERIVKQLQHAITAYEQGAINEQDLSIRIAIEAEPFKEFSRTELIIALLIK